MPESEPAIVIGIPGKWNDHSDIVTSIVQKSGGYLFAGKILMHIETSTSFELEIYEHDPTLAEKVRSSSLGQIPEEDLQAVEEHTHTLYLLSDEAGREVVERLMDAVVGLLNAGGILVKIEYAGFSVSAEQWKKSASLKMGRVLYRSLVTLVGEENEYFTCGMSAFELPDCAILDCDLQTSFDLATEFCSFMMDETPILGEGHTFSIAEDAPRFRLSYGDYTYYSPDDSFHNPNGLWTLTPL